MLIGTRCGRICGWDPAGATPAPQLGLPARLNAVTSLHAFGAGRVVFGGQAGAAVVQSVEDPADCQEFRLGAPAQCSAFSAERAVFFFGSGGAVHAQRLTDAAGERDFAELCCTPWHTLNRMHWAENRLALYPRDGQFALVDGETGAQLFHAKASRGDELNVSPAPQFVDGLALGSGCFAAIAPHQVG